MSSDLTQSIDHTHLKPSTGKAAIEKLCAEAKDYGFFSVCVLPHYVPLAKSLLKDSLVKICTVVGFPLGANATEVKFVEAKLACEQGAHEIDMVININAVKDGDWEFVTTDIASVVAAAEGATVKVILENCELTKEEIVKSCAVAKLAGAHFVKSSTGMGKGGATEDDIKLMRVTVGSSFGVKASGGVRTTEDALKMLEAGANRIGASSSIEIVEGLN